jgi:hypothetical protein
MGAGWVFALGGCSRSCEFGRGLWLPRTKTSSDVGQREYGGKGLTDLRSGSHFSCLMYFNLCVYCKTLEITDVLISDFPKYKSMALLGFWVL